MSLYNQLFHYDPLAHVLLKSLALDPRVIPRFRDCFLLEGRIAVYTRTGGGNRELNDRPWSMPAGAVLPAFTAPASWTAICQSHPDFERWEDDDYDDTYALFFFRYPEAYRPELEEAAQLHTRVRPKERWLALYEEMKDPHWQPPAGMKTLMDQIASVMKGGE